MKVKFQRAALDDIKNPKGGIPRTLRKGLREQLRAMRFPHQGIKCTNVRYPDTYIKYKNWFVMYRVVDQGTIDVLAVEYNYGQIL